jgi:hypothetical protein
MIAEQASVYLGRSATGQCSHGKRPWHPAASLLTCRRYRSDGRRPQDDDGASALIDTIANTPVRSAAGRVLPGILMLQQMARRGESSPAAGPVTNSAAAVATFRATTRADAEREAGRPDSSDRHARSRGADVVEQVGETASELGLIQAKTFLPLPRLLIRVSTIGRITPPPRCRLG